MTRSLTPLQRRVLRTLVGSRIPVPASRFSGARGGNVLEQLLVARLVTVDANGPATAVSVTDAGRSVLARFRCVTCEGRGTAPAPHAPGVYVSCPDCPPPADTTQDG